MTPERISRLRAVLDRRQPDLTVVTDFVNKQRNLSAIVRNCDAAGVMQLHAVIGDEDYRAFRGTAMGSHQWVEVVAHEDLDSALVPLRQAGMQVVAAHLVPHAVDFRELDYTRPTAVLLGAERRGISADGEQMAEEVRQRMVRVVDELANAVDCVQNPNAGKVVMRRLNRIEYRNTIRDLLGVDYEPAINFPGDDVGYGFDNIGDVLSLPPLLMEKYLLAADAFAESAGQIDGRAAQGEAVTE